MIVNHGAVSLYDNNLGLSPIPYMGVLLEIGTRIPWNEADLRVYTMGHIIFKTSSKKGDELFIMKVL